MTQAQYHRAVAGQNQSKVGDQWAFFQAKRIRGTSYETTAVGLLAQKADPFTLDALLNAPQRLIGEIQLTLKDLKPNADTLREKLKTIEKNAEKLQADIKAALNPGADGWQGAKTKVTADALKNALDALDAYPAEIKPPKFDDALLNEILDDISKFKPEKAIAPKTLRLTEETIDKALEEAKDHTAKVTQRSKKIDRVLEEIDILVDRQAALVRAYQRLLMTKANADAIAETPQHLDRARVHSATLLADYKATRFGFDARRYEEDARSNQKAAYLYEIQMLQNSARSDKHLKRSFGFMLAMLIAQIGVTIASLAMAMKRRVPVWGMAALSGVIAILFGAYVFLELGPLFF